MYYLIDEHDWFWDIESDIMKDYKHYFPASNSKILAKLYDGNKRENTEKK